MSDITSRVSKFSKSSLVSFLITSFVYCLVGLIVLSIIGFLLSIIPYSQLIPGFTNWFQTSIVGTYTNWVSDYSALTTFFAFILYWIGAPVVILVGLVSISMGILFGVLQFIEELFY